MSRGGEKVDEENRLTEEVKKALHGSIDHLELIDFEIQSIRITVQLKRKKAKQGAEKPKE